MMQRTRIKKALSFILCMVLIAAMTLFTTGCNDNTQSLEGGKTTPAGQSAEEPAGQMAEEPAGQVAEEPTGRVADGSVLGTGEMEFTFTVIDVDGVESTFTIHTDKTIVGEALEELGMIAGEAGAYGLYVKTVNGITLDYDRDGKYWAFYIEGEYGVSGVDTTEIEAGATYSFKAEK